LFVIWLIVGTKSTNYIAKSKVLKVIQIDNPVRGIAQLGTELFVCTRLSFLIKINDLNTYCETRQVTVPGMKPWKLASCKKYNCLYISDEFVDCIHRVDLSNDTCSKWSVKGDPYGVSVTRAFTLLVTLRPQSIAEYTTNGSLIRSITLDVSIDDPRHAIELPCGQFVVCHMGSAQHRVCVVDTTGHIVRSYGGPKGSSTGQLNGPLNLAVDTRGYVFVADYYNDRVQVFSPTLTHLGDVTTPGYRLQRPAVLHLDEPSDRLYILNWSETSKVFVLSAAT
jgi:hypothetical protein